MLSLPLLVTTLALAPTGGDSRFELSLGTNIQVTPVAADFPSGAGGGLYTTGDGHGALTVFSRRVVDDGAPLALQPFLQRVGELHIEGGGGGINLSPDPGSSIGREEGAYGYVTVEGFGYLGRHLYGYLSAGVDYNDRLDTNTFSGSSTINTTLTIPLAVAGGVRFGDLLVDAGWRVTPTRLNIDSFQVPFWGGVWLHAYTVIRRRVGLVAEVDVEDGGAGAYGRASVYLARRFSLGAFVRGNQSRTTSNGFQTTQDHAGGGVDFEAWRTPRLAFALSYSFDWVHFTGANGRVGQTDYESVIGLSIRLRPR